MEVDLLVKPRNPSPRVVELAAKVAGKAGFYVEKVDGGYLVVHGERSAVLEAVGARGEPALVLSLSMLLLSSAAALAMKAFMRRVKLGYRRDGASLESWAQGEGEKGERMTVTPVAAKIVKVNCTTRNLIYSLQAGLENLGYTAVEPPKNVVKKEG